MVTWHCNAPAKINLALHVTGQRNDGYHELETLVAFTGLCDRISVTESRGDSAPNKIGLKTSGPFAAGLPAAENNLAVQAVKRLMERTGSWLHGQQVTIRLEKNLPPASGIGGGSSDAGAALIAYSKLAGISGREEIEACAASLGADVPMCIVARPLIAKGIGDQISPFPDFPEIALLLVNPLVEISTPDVFKALRRQDNPGFPQIGSKIVEVLPDLRNDLEAAAKDLVPAIGEAIEALKASGAPRLVRMSGSGATCFGLYDTLQAAQTAALQIASRRPNWWVQASRTVSAPADYMERAWQE